jgi:hypothetical protein
LKSPHAKTLSLTILFYIWMSFEFAIGLQNPELWKTVKNF